MTYISLYGSVIFLMLIILLSAGIYLYTRYLERDIGTLRDQTALVDRQIETLKKDPTIMIAHIIDSWTIRPSIDLVTLIDRFRSIASEYGVRFQGFSIMNDILSTQVVAINPDRVNHPDPISAIFKLMNTQKFADTGFVLEPITAISGDITERSTSLQFRVTSSR